MISSGDDPVYSPFLKWNPDDEISLDSFAHAFNSLVSMIRDGYPFDEVLVSQASQFVSSLSRDLRDTLDLDDLMTVIGQGSSDPAAVFVDSMTVLLSSPYSSVFMNSLSLIRMILNWCSLSTNLALVSSSLFSRILPTPHLRDLSVIVDKGILKDVVRILRDGIELTSTDGIEALSTDVSTASESVRDVVLHELLIPIEPSLVQISRNPHLLLWNDVYKKVLKLLTKIFKVSAFHQPTAWV
ncbi:hypothetical protein BLNAU_15856 [Blattamonas nauphoetae]|uniref:Uncharacterized protein n=1 Tax=Blattamonas nauphoetae TaxID=2049346 RepID=A0ABQ9X9N5_9EUKA|nr:hypothetical protein BLNAU_15856 [Blattamonas nauphoetae]